MNKVIIALIVTLYSITIASQEKQVKIYFGESSISFAKKNGIKPLTQKERDGYDYICENMTSRMLKILNVSVDDSRRMIVTVEKVPNANYDDLAKYIFDCSEYVYKGLESCICIDGNTLKETSNEILTAIQIGEYKKK